MNRSDDKRAKTDLSVTFPVEVAARVFHPHRGSVRNALLPTPYKLTTAKTGHA